jgi:hypothetical protein
LQARFPGETRSSWKDEQLEVVHEVKWVQEKNSIASVVSLKNLCNRTIYVPRPLVMPWATGTDKNNLRVLDDKNRDLPVKGYYAIFRIDSERNEMRPYAKLSPGQTIVSSFDLRDNFEGIDKTPRIWVQLAYASRRTHTYVVDEEGRLVKTECWSGEFTTNPLEVEITAG